MGNREASAAYRQLGGMLRRVRKEAGLTATELAKEADWPLLKVSRMENGQRPSTTHEVIVYAVTCGLKIPELQPLLALTRRADHREGYYLSDARIGGSLQSLIFHESSAKHSIIYEPHHEQALRLRVGTDKIMLEQLLHIVLTGALRNVTVRIVPSAAGERSAFGAFRLMEFHQHRPMVYLDNLRAGLILDDPDYVNSYYDLVPILADVALDEGQSRKFAADLADAYDRGSQRGVAAVLAQEQLQPRVGLRLHRGGVVESPTPIYE